MKPYRKQSMEGYGRETVGRKGVLINRQVTNKILKVH